MDIKLWQDNPATPGDKPELITVHHFGVEGKPTEVIHGYRPKLNGKRMIYAGGKAALVAARPCKDADNTVIYMDIASSPVMMEAKIWGMHVMVFRDNYTTDDVAMYLERLDDVYSIDRVVIPDCQ